MKWGFENENENEKIKLRSIILFKIFKGYKGNSGLWRPITKHAVLQLIRIPRTQEGRKFSIL